MTDGHTDRVTVGVTEEAAGDLSVLMEAGWFDQEKDAYLVAISVAIASGADVSGGPVRGTRTKFNVGTLDSDGKLRLLIKTLESDEGVDAYDISERMAHVGLAILRTRLIDSGATLAEVLFPDDEVSVTENDEAV